MRCLIATRVTPPKERRLIAVEGKQSMIGYGDEVHVTAELVKNLFWSAERGFGINDPFLLVQLPDKSFKALRPKQRLDLAREV